MQSPLICWLYIKIYLACHHISVIIFFVTHMSLDITILKGSLYIRCPIDQLLKVRHFRDIASYTLTTIKTVLSYSKKYSTVGDYYKKQVEENVFNLLIILHINMLSVYNSSHPHICYSVIFYISLSHLRLVNF